MATIRKKRRRHGETASLLAVLLAAGLGITIACGDDTVEPVPPPAPVPTTITISPASATLQSLGETVRLAATVQDQNGQTMSGATVAWTSGDPSVATVDASGLVTAVANGTTSVTATAGSASASTAVTVDQVLAGLVVEPSVDTLWALGDTLRLSAEATDANGHVVPGAEFAWASSDSSVAIVDASGLATAVGNGTAMVTASAGSSSGSAAVTIEQVLADVVVEPSADTLWALGDTLRLSAEATDANGHAVAAAEFAWASSDSSVAIVDASGLATALGNGTASVTASSGAVFTSAEVTVEQRPASVDVGPATSTLASVGDTVRLSAQILDANLNPVGAVEGVTWSSDNHSVATVAADGLVTAVGNGSASVTASFEDLSTTATVAVADIGRFLEDRPGIAAAMVWLGPDNRSRPYTEWPQPMKRKLVLAVSQLLGEGTGLPDVMVNQAADFLADDDYAVTVLSEEDAEDIYLANIAQSLILETTGTLPWSLDDLSHSELELLLGWRGFFRGYSSPDARHWSVPPGVTGYFHYYGASPAPPNVVRDFIVDNDLVGHSRYETIIRVIDWTRQHLTHFSGSGTAGNYENHWGYRGIPPLARMFVKTTRRGSPDYRSSTAHFTAGCGGTTWFFIHVLRAVNIPVEDVDMPDSGHATPGFPSEGLYLSHGDDPYSKGGWYSPPFPEPYPSTEIPISEATYHDWFSPSNSRQENDQNVGRRTTELIVEYLPQYLLHIRCEDRANGLSKESSDVYRPESMGIGRYWTIAELDALRFWERMDAKIERYGGCPIPYPTRGG